MDRAITIILFIFCFSSHAQHAIDIPDGPSYSFNDSLARSVIYKGDIHLLTRELTENYTTQLEKARAIFVWITDNIAYDYKHVNKHKKIKFPKCKKGEDCDAKIVKWENKYLKKVICKKKGICDGYSRLFKKMCDYAGIQNSIVYGYTKQRPEEVGKMGALNHAWNVMLIDGKYYFVDATWGAGYCNRDKRNQLEPFQKKFNEFYWLTPAEKLFITHFPKDEEWVRHIPYNKAKEIYKAGPYIDDFALKHIDVLKPEPGPLKVKPGDTIHFKIKYTDPLYPPKPTYIYIASNLQKFDTKLLPPPTYEEISLDDYDTSVIGLERIILTDEDLKKIGFTPFTMENNIYEFDYIVSKKNLRYVDINFNYLMLLRFKIDVAE